MRSLNLFFVLSSEKWMCQAQGRVSSDTRMHICGCAHIHAWTENFFFGAVTYTSAVTMVTQVCDPAGARDWLERSEVEEGRRTLVEGHRRVWGGDN